MTISNHKNLWIGIAVAVLVGAGGIAVWQYSQPRMAESTSSRSATVTAATATDDSDSIDWSSLPTTEVALTDEGLAVTAAGTYVLSGSSAGQVTVNTDGNVRLVLSGVNIKSSQGAAIHVEHAETAVIQLADGTSNTIEDATTRSDDAIDGAIYSSGNLAVHGSGSLDITAHFADGIASEKQLVVAGGDITIDSSDDAIRADQKISITGGKITINTSVEGIEAPVIVIDGGDITLYASDDGINASASDSVTTGLSITINGGTLNVTVGSGDTDALDSNGDLYVNGGTITITAPTSSFDFDGSGAINGGTVTVNGQRITEMPAQMTGGPGGQ